MLQAFLSPNAPHRVVVKINLWQEGALCFIAATLSSLEKKGISMLLLTVHGESSPLLTMVPGGIAMFSFPKGIPR